MGNDLTTQTGTKLIPKKLNRNYDINRVSTIVAYHHKDSEAALSSLQIQAFNMEYILIRMYNSESASFLLAVPREDLMSEWIN